MLGLNETVDQLAVANSVPLYGCVLRTEDGYVLRRALEFKIEGQWVKGRSSGNGWSRMRTTA